MERFVRARYWHGVDVFTMSCGLHHLVFFCFLRMFIAIILWDCFINENKSVPSIRQAPSPKTRNHRLALPLAWHARQPVRQ